MKLNKTELLDNGPVQLRFEKQLFEEDGTPVNAGWHREVRNPGDDISDLPVDTQAIINAHWTTERIATWEIQANIE